MTTKTTTATAPEPDGHQPQPVIVPVSGFGLTSLQITNPAGEKAQSPLLQVRTQWGDLHLLVPADGLRALATLILDQVQEAPKLDLDTSKAPKGLR